MNNYEYGISACLLGLCVRYDGKSQANEACIKLYKEKKALPICPEVFGGMKTPRIPCEIIDGIVYNKEHENKQEYFERGANECLALLKAYNIKHVILKDKSPSCGSTLIYNGKFDGGLIEGQGVFTKKCQENGILVESELDY